MLEFDGATLKTLPMLLFFVRCTYAIVVLIKMHVAVSAPGSELGKVMKPEEMKVEYYMGSLMTLFAGGKNDEGAENGGRPHPKILMIWGVLRDWFEKHKEGLTRGDRDEEQQMQSSEASKADKSTQQQTGLQLLSQVATGDRQQPSHQQQQPTLPSGSAAENMQSGDWTVQSPYIFDHYANRALNGANTLIPSDHPNQQPRPTQAAFSDTMPPSTVSRSWPRRSYAHGLLRLGHELRASDGHGARRDGWFARWRLGWLVLGHGSHGAIRIQRRSWWGWHW